MSRTREPKSIDYVAAARVLKVSRRIAITTHSRADGDAIGSVGALARVMEQRGKQVAAYLHERVSARYRFLPDVERIGVWRPEAAASALAGADLLVILDTCARMQLGDVAEAITAAPLHKLAIDHHLTRDDIVDELLLDENAGACAQIITGLCDQAGWNIDAQTAALLFCGLGTDTGWFRFSNTDAAVLRIAARLVEAGAEPSRLYEAIYQQDPEARARLVGEALSSFELLADGRLAVIKITRETLRRCRADETMTEEIVNEPQRLGSVVVCVLFAEPAGDGPIRVNLRSKGDVDVAEIARQFGGGGHSRAAGVRIEGSLESVSKRVVSAILAALEGE